MKLETLLARITDNCKVYDPYGASHIPIYQTATFDLKKQSGERKIYDYSRSDNPTRNAVENIIAQAEGGSGCICTNTGLSAIAVLFETTLRSGDTVLMGLDSYGGTYRLLHEMSDKYGIKIIYTNFTQPEAVEKILGSNNVKLTLVESPTNPGFKIIDIKKIAELCKKDGSLLAVDNSVATFASQLPLALGADFSFSSTTKFISGHGAAVSGVITAATEEWYEKIWTCCNAGGRAQSPFDSFLISLGLPTLVQRMKIQEKSALRVAEYFSGRTDIIKVTYPGLPSHPQYALAKRQMKICPGVLTVDMQDNEKAEAFIKKTKLFGEKASFGTADSRVEQPVKISHHSFSEEDLNSIGLSASTLRISIGLEDVDDLLDDIESALK